MLHSNVVDFGQMREKLLPLSTVQEALASTEPLAEVAFVAGHSANAFFQSTQDGQPWYKASLTDAAPVWLDVPSGERYQLTHQAAMQLASECHVTRGYQELVPGQLLAENVNWWLKNGLGDKELKLLVSGTGGDKDNPGQNIPLVRAVCRHTVSPFSNLHLLEVMLAGLQKQYGEGEVLVDYKFHHDLERTALRLIIPGYERVIEGTSVHDDTWSLGLDYYNSLIGLKQTTLAGYLFRWWCTNGCTDVANQVGGFSRRGSSEEDAMAWAQESVDEILGGLETTFDQVQALTTQPVGGDVVTVLKGLFREFGIPKRERTRIIETMADTQDLNMYELLSAVTMAANIEGLDDRDVHRLLNMGGHITHASTGLCSNCHQLLPEGFTVPSDGESAGQADLDAEVQHAAEAS
jgi:hypothetical protein